MGDFTCRDLVQQYLDRINAYDKRGPALNAIITIRPNALSQADAIELEFLSTPWSEPTLITLVYSYEQVTQHRRASPDGAAAGCSRLAIREAMTSIQAADKFTTRGV
jgi:Asp-tRNA(Asn)/Glu-tRNA(Gln) amidotransferase A subunit family amidase